MKRTAFILSLSLIALVPALRFSSEPGDGGSPGDSLALKEPLADVKLAGGILPDWVERMGILAGVPIGASIGGAIAGARIGSALAGRTGAGLGGVMGVWIAVDLGAKIADEISDMKKGCGFWGCRGCGFWGCD